MTVVDLTLEQLNEREWMSVRAFNICKDNGIKSLLQLISIYNQRKSFLDFRNCGIKTEKELIEICVRYRDSFQRQILVDSSEDNSTKLIIAQLSPFKKYVLNRYLENTFASLSVRGQNGLNTFVDSVDSESPLIQKVIIENVDFLKIKNIGTTTLSELESFKENSSQFIHKLNLLDEAVLTIEYLKLIIESYYNGSKPYLEENIQEFINESGKIKLFKVFDFLLQRDFLFKPNYKLIFEYLYNRPYSDRLSLEAITKHVGVTRERVRQIKVKLPDEIKVNCIFIHSLRLDDLAKYDLSALQDLIIIDEVLAGKINKLESVNFNYLLYSIVFGDLFKGSHMLFGNDEEIAKNKITKRNRNRKYMHGYLINSSIYAAFDFPRFVEDIFDKLTDRITESYEVYFEGYLQDFISVNDISIQQRVMNICEQIIFSEFELVIDPNGFLVFQRNSKKLNSEYAEEILEENQRLMTVEQITDAIRSKYPELEPTEKSIRGSLIKEKEVFIYIGRTSTYGLKRWENEHKNLKGGTIRDIAEEYLMQFDEPKHIYEITQYVNKYRNTNEKSILSNFSLEGDNKRFIVYDGGFVGLLSKIYSQEKLNFTSVKGFHFTSDRLNKFRGRNLEDLVEFYTTKYGYKRAQVLSIFETRITNGETKLDANNTIL